MHEDVVRLWTESEGRRRGIDENGMNTTLEVERTKRGEQMPSDNFGQIMDKVDSQNEERDEAVASDGWMIWQHDGR